MTNTPYNPPLFGISPNPAAKNIQLTHYYHDLHMDTFIFWPIGNEETQTHLFAEEVVPALRSALGQK